MKRIFMYSLRALCVLSGFIFMTPLEGQSFSTTQAEVNQKLEAAVQEYSVLQNKIAEEKIPLAKKLNALQAELLELRFESDKLLSLRDNKDVDLASLEKNVKVRQDDVDYMANLMQEYLNSLSARMDASELQIYDEELKDFLSANDDSALSQSEKFNMQLKGVRLGLKRMDDIIGGSVFSGKAVLPSGQYADGSFVLFGPIAYFVDNAGALGGLSVQGPSDEPTVGEILGAAPVIKAVAENQSGTLPLDSTLGNAMAIAATKETISEHVLKGGVWAFPIIFSAALALIIAIFKFFQLYTIRGIPQGAVAELVKLIRGGKKEEAVHFANSLPNSPTSEMLVIGAMNCDEPKELLEEIMTEKIIAAQPKVERLLAAIATTAATAPLLGLLGTVTGMINTFKLITIYGTGDAKSLSSGISEALITTELGLVVAIPALIFHAILIRKSKSILASLESTAITFVNGIAKSSLDKAA